MPHSGNVGVLPVGDEVIPLEFDLYEMIKEGKSLPNLYKIVLDEYSKKRIPSKDFLNFASSVVASDKIDKRMKEFLDGHCYTIAMIAPFGGYTYYLPKKLIDAVDLERSEKRKYGENQVLISDYDFSNLVIDDSKIGDISIFQLEPNDLYGATYVTEAFVKLYKECRCKGIRFLPVETTSRFLGNA